jgi:hypothetical protein
MKRNLSVLLLASTLLACQATDALAPAKVAGEKATKATAATISYGEGGVENGVFYPAWEYRAVIENQSTWVQLPLCGPSSCSSEVHAYHAGMWNHTNQSSTASVDGATTPPFGTTNWDCIRHQDFGPIHNVCTKGAVDNAQPISISSNCGFSISAATTHEAWWDGVFSIQLEFVSFPGYRIGLETQVSAGPARSAPDCPTDGGGGGGLEGGGSGPGEGQCGDVYLYWYDEYGTYNETYLFTIPC